MCEVCCTMRNNVYKNKTQKPMSRRDFAVNSALRKIFDTKSQDIVNECREIFNCLSAESTFASRRWKFLEKITVSQNKLCSIFVVNDTKELSEIRQSWRYNSAKVTSDK